MQATILPLYSTAGLPFFHNAHKGDVGYLSVIALVRLVNYLFVIRSLYADLRVLYSFLSAEAVPGSLDTTYCAKRSIR